MWFIAKDKSVPISDLVLSDNLATYHQVISFSTSAKLYVNEGVIDAGFSKYDVHIVNQMRNGDDGMKVDCVTKAVHKAFNSVTAGYNGWTTVKKLFNKLGYTYQSDYQTNNTYFSIPQCMVTTLFDNLTKYASFANGGGAHFYMSYDGTIHGYDYKLIKEKGSVNTLIGKITSEQIRTDFSDYTPSEYDIICWDNDNNRKRETLSLQKSYGKGVVNINDTTGVWKDVIKQELTNTFYNKWYNGHTITLNVAMGGIPTLGSLVKIDNDDNDTYIVKAVNIAYNELQEVPVTTAVLISNPVI